MPRSRTTSPLPPDLRRSFVPGLTISLSPDCPHYNSPSASTGGGGGPRNKKHKYIKPRLGASFQAKVESFNESSNQGGAGIGGEIDSDVAMNDDINSYYGMKGGVFACSTSSLASLTNSTGNGAGRRKKAGRPPKSGKGKGTNTIFQNHQPIYYNSNIQPPRGGLCIHRPQPANNKHSIHTTTDCSTLQTLTETNKNKSGVAATATPDTSATSSPHDEFLTFTRNIMLQTPFTKAEEQKNTNTLNVNACYYQRIDHVWRNVIDKKAFEEAYEKTMAANAAAAATGSTIQVKKARGRKRKIDLNSSASAVAIASTTAVTTATPTTVSGNLNNNKMDDSSSVTTANVNDAVGVDTTADGNVNVANENGTPPANTSSNNNIFKRADVALGLEDDELYLEYLQRKHHGNTDTAQLQIISNLCRGIAIKTRRHHKKLKKENEMNVPLSAVLAPLSDSWRRRYERMDSSSTMLGDHRLVTSSSSSLGATASYPFFTKKQNCDGNRTKKKNIDVHVDNDNDALSSNLYPWLRNWNNVNGDTVLSSQEKESTTGTLENIQSSISTTSSWGDNCNNIDDFERNEELMKIWKLILDNGQKAIYTIDNSKKVTSSSKKENEQQQRLLLPKVRDLLVLIAKAYSLPKPEDVFGRRDSISKQISQCLNSILDNIENARGIVGKLVDAIYDDGGSGTGIDLQKLQKTVDESASKSSVYIEEIDITREMLKEALDWEAKLTESPSNTVDDEENMNDISMPSSEDLNLPQQSLSTAEELALDGRSVSLRPKSLIDLDDRIQRAYDLRNRIREWNKVFQLQSQNDNDKDNVKQVASMIKEANQINLGFPELSVLSKVHRDAEEWVDRAAIALRSKISLNELESLVETGQKLPMGLTGTLEKLTSRYKQACEWVEDLKEEIPCPLESVNSSCSNLTADHHAEWLLRIREALEHGENGKASVISDLLVQGSRLSVDINVVHLLQTAIDSRNWSVKAKRWVPSSGDQFRRGKIEDLRDHLESGQTIVERANALTDGKSDWSLDFEQDIASIVESADGWYDKHQSFLERDNRRSEGRYAISFPMLELIVDEANSIPTNLGNPSIKINRIYSEAKSWLDANRNLLSRCDISIGEKESDTATSTIAQVKSISLNEVNSAIESAEKDLTVDLEEVELLKGLANQSQDWFDRALEFAPKRNKRIVRGKKILQPKYSIQEVVSLIESSCDIPMDTTKEIERLRMLLSDVQSWRLQAQVKLREIIDTFNLLRGERVGYYGLPDNFLEKYAVGQAFSAKESDLLNFNDSTMEGETQAIVEMQSDSEDSLIKGVSQSSSAIGVNAYRMVSNLVKSAESISLFSFEEEIAEKLFTLSKWCKKAAILIGSHTDVFIDKRYKKDLDKLISAGEGFNILDEISSISEDDIEEKALSHDLKTSMASFMTDDIVRLKILRVHRDNFYSWCEKVNNAYRESDKKIPLKTLKLLAEESCIYPQNAETVKKIRKDASSGIEWAKSINDVINLGNKFTLSEAKNKLDIAAKLKFTCSEFNELRKAYQSAKAWSKKVKKSGLNEGSAQIYHIKELIKEHESFHISMPTEIDALNQALRGYCICRRPYEGFMIGCDDCDEWYHGACVGVTQAQCEKIDKYLCTRCCVKKMFKNASNTIAGVIRKWCDHKELTKSRSQASQKHQRKIREKKREIVKWKDELQNNVVKLRELKSEELHVLNSTSSIPQSADAPPNQVGSSISLKISDRNNNIVKATAALEQCNRRLEELSEVGIKRKAIMDQEDAFEYTFRYWCVMLKTKVLVPETTEFAEKSRPCPSFNCQSASQLLSGPMLEVIEAASKYGISDFPDIVSATKSLHCIAWCQLALMVLRRKPSIAEVKVLIGLSNVVKLPEVKSITMLRSMMTRTVAWQAKVNKTLLPVRGETKPFNSEELIELRAALNHIPLITPEERKLTNAIADVGARHCICGGPRDEIEMYSCDKCSSFYHLNCANLAGGVCPVCKNPASETHARKDSGMIGKDKVDDISPNAPDPSKLWPPFGLDKSVEAVKAIGVCSTLKFEDMHEPKSSDCQDISSIKGVQKSNVRTNICRATEVGGQSNMNAVTSVSGMPPAAKSSPYLKVQNNALVPVYPHSQIPVGVAIPPSQHVHGTNQMPNSSDQILNMTQPHSGACLVPREIADSAVKVALSAHTPVLDSNAVLLAQKAAENAVKAVYSLDNKNVPVPTNSTQKPHNILSNQYLIDNSVMPERSSWNRNINYQSHASTIASDKRFQPIYPNIKSTNPNNYQSQFSAHSATEKATSFMGPGGPHFQKHHTSNLHMKPANSNNYQSPFSAPSVTNKTTPPKDASTIASDPGGTFIQNHQTSNLHMKSVHPNNYQTPFIAHSATDKTASPKDASTNVSDPGGTNFQKHHTNGINHSMYSRKTMEPFLNGYEKPTSNSAQNPALLTTGTEYNDNDKTNNNRNGSEIVSMNHSTQIIVEPSVPVKKSPNNSVLLKKFG